MILTVVHKSGAVARSKAEVQAGRNVHIKAVYFIDQVNLETGEVTKSKERRFVFDTVFHG